MTTNNYRKRVRMGESNKVLSVTYGTFSCRLEGFDDSVETMKTVVSYFHDLAGHNRFMDLDPQAPDLEELADLTVDDTGTQVDATTDDGVVSLRVQPQETPNDDAAEHTNLRVARPARVIRNPVEEVAQDTTFGQDDDDYADVEAVFDDVSDLDDISDLDELEDDIEAEEFVAETTEDAAIDGVDETDDDAILAVTTPDDIVSENADDNDHDYEDTFENVDEPAPEDVAEEPHEEEVEAEAEDAPFYDPASAHEDESGDSVAAKLERIRALVGRVPPANRPEPAKTIDPTKVGSVVDRLSALTGTPPKEDEQQTEDLVDDFDFKSDDAEPLVLSNEAVEDDALASDADAFDDDGFEESQEVAAFDNTQSEESYDDDELGTAPVEDVEDGSADDSPRRRALHSKRGNLPQQDDDEMSRIMSQADERLNEPEGRRHRDAFAQLKAAVAATEAARQLGDQNTQSDPRDAFREDLDEARRRTDEDEQPENVDEAEDAPSEDAATEETPLRLVAENRIEENAKPSGTADRLRQIASVKETSGNASGGFAEFAKAQGATDLSDLLEAAAAYIAYVEGDEDFSRPQVMKKVQMASADEFSREDGLRSFGRLLRQSRIIKLNNGRFQVSADTRFRPDDKAAQG